MRWEWIVAAILGFFALVWRQAIQYHKQALEKQKRELTFKAEVERTVRENSEKSEQDILDDIHKRYGPGE